MNISAEQFFSLEKQIIESGADADLDSFAAIKRRLADKEKMSADEFARQACYVVLAGGFSQKTAKKIHKEIMEILNGPQGRHPRPRGDDDASHRLYETLFSIFRNKNKINAIIKLWTGRADYRDGYYALATLDDKLKYLSRLPHIGKITANHLARNLGENLVKYDIWIQRLAVAGTELEGEIDNGDLHPAVKAACDEMFAALESATGLPRGYIDVVLWKSCQTGLLLNKESGRKEQAI